MGQGGSAEGVSPRLPPFIPASITSIAARRVHMDVRLTPTSSTKLGARSRSSLSQPSERTSKDRCGVSPARPGTLGRPCLGRLALRLRDAAFAGEVYDT